MSVVALATIGECMIELSGEQNGLWRMGFAGDTFNTAWYARALLPNDRRVAFITALGDDPFSREMTAFIAAAGVDSERIRPIPGQRPGLYIITLNRAERSFTYWRGQSAARQLAEEEDWLRRALAGVEMLYFTGITLAILPPRGRQRLFSLLAERRRIGTRIAFDPNFRQALWPDADEARSSMTAALRLADIALPTFEDEAKLFGERSAEATCERIAALGVAEIVVKNGSRPCLVVSGKAHQRVPAVTPERVIDTTGAGDAFAGVYLAARLTGSLPAASARLAHLAAAEVVGVHGALARIEGNKLLEAAEMGGS
jgi:2-dehydro-3-deoxygluconokinase